MTPNEHTEQSERAEFYWLVELFYTNGKSTGLYLTSLPAPNHQTPDVHKAWKLTKKESAERQARKAPTIAGAEWRPVEHGFHTGRFSTEEEGDAYMHGWFEGQAALLAADKTCTYEGSDWQRLDDLVQALTGDEGEDDSLKVLERLATELNGRTVRELLAADKPAESGGEAVARIERRFGGVRIVAPDGSPFDMLRYEGASLYTKPQADKAGGEVVVVWHGGLSNEDLLMHWHRKVRNSSGPTDEQLTGFALGVEVGISLCPQPQPSALPDDVVKDREDFARHIAEESPLGSDDWACSRCHPNSDMLKPGFVCVVHRAIDAAMLKEGE